MTKTKGLFVLLAGLMLSLSAYAATLQKWKDDKGETHYGDTIPAEYANKSHSELGKAGSVVSTHEVLTPEERRAKEVSEAKDKAVLEAKRSQRLNDSSLLNTYSNVEEIDRKRTRDIQMVDARSQFAAKQLRDANKNLSDVQQLVVSRTRPGKPTPQYLKDEIQAAQDLISQRTENVIKIDAEKAALEARYDADKARYKELTGK